MRLPPSYAQSEGAAFDVVNNSVKDAQKSELIVTAGLRGLKSKRRNGVETRQRERGLKVRCLVKSGKPGKRQGGAGLWGLGAREISQFYVGMRMWGPRMANLTAHLWPFFLPDLKFLYVMVNRSSSRGRTAGRTACVRSATSWRPGEASTSSPTRPSRYVHGL